jgi:hypothetical protein
MVDYFVVSKSGWARPIPCTGPVTAQYEECKLIKAMREAGVQPDVEVRMKVRSRPHRALADTGHKRSTKLRYK